MPISDTTAVLQSVVALLFLLALVFKLWPAFRLDKFRQKMFCVRDELFDYAASGNIGFNDPAYRLLRQSMNGFIRYGHHLTFFRLCLTLSRWRVLSEMPAPLWARSWERALASIADDRVKKDLQRFHGRAISLVAQRLVLGSPALLAVVCVGVMGTFAWTGLQNLRQLVRDLATTTLSRVVDPRLLEEEAARLAAG